jgi:hypothetical protein
VPDSFCLTPHEVQTPIQVHEWRLSVRRKGVYNCGISFLCSGNADGIRADPDATFISHT